VFSWSAHFSMHAKQKGWEQPSIRASASGVGSSRQMQHVTGGGSSFLGAASSFGGAASSSKALLDGRAMMVGAALLRVPPPALC
jgi:hypothetical protein